MRYRIITILWIVFLIFANLYEEEVLLYDTISSQSQTLYYNFFTTEEDYFTNEEVYFNIDNLPNYDEIEYFLKVIKDNGDIYIYGNDAYFENLNYSPPNNQQYYGSKNISDMEKIGQGPYFNLSKNIYYFNLESLNHSYILESDLDTYELHYRAQDKEKMYNVDKVVSKTDLIGIFSSSHSSLPLLFTLFTFIINLFFFIMLLMFLFVDINLFSKEISIKKSLGYSFEEIFYSNFKNQLIKSSIYFSAVLLPIFLIFYDGSAQSYDFLFSSIILIVKIYILSNILYILAFTYCAKKIKIVDTLKGKINLSAVNSMSTFTNCVSKIIIILILAISIIPFYQLCEVGNQYSNYIKGNENFVNYNQAKRCYDAGAFSEDDFIDKEEQRKIKEFLTSEYDKYNAQGAVLNTRSFFTSQYFSDSEEYLNNEYYNDQLMITNTNYMNLIKFPLELDSDENYLLIPSTMKGSTDDIKNMIKEDYGFETFTTQYYNSSPIYTYNPKSYTKTRGNIYHPIILVANDLSETTQIQFIVQAMYYRNDSPEDYESNHLTDSFMYYSRDIIKKGVSLLILLLFFITAILISSYYMVSSHLETNGKEISVKRILGYSNFKIYRPLYILDFICYTFFFVYIICIALLANIPWWFIFIFCLFMIFLNELNRRFMIYKVEKNNIVNKIKGEL